MKRVLNIKILGAGPTGSLLAIALSKAGTKITIYDPKLKEDLINLDRAYALTHSSYNLLKELNLIDLIKINLNPFNRLNLSDIEIKKSLKYKLTDLKKSDRNKRSLGWIVGHQPLMKMLIRSLEKNKLVNLNLGQEGNPYIEHFDYVIAADGSFSKSILYWGIKKYHFKYKQGCVTSKILIRGGNDNVAHEILRKEGPFAVLPMGGERYQIVMSTSLQDCERIVKLNNQKYLNKLNSILPIGYEPDCVLGERKYFPNHFSLTNCLHKGRFILVGETAHSFHPVGGQGLNLCWRDVKVLTDVIVKYSENKILKRFIPLIYTLTRLPDLFAVAIMTDSLVRIFSNKLYIFKPLRWLIIKSLKNFSFLRKFSLSIMTNGISNI